MTSCLDQMLLDGKEAGFWRTEKGIHDDISNGFPQGSVLGSAFLMLFTNDLPEDGDSNVKTYRG